ncbi:vacuolar protein sorting-associated protein 52 homolog isoform X2 [Lynx canadensis]|uniref:Vacuolar protein sorting-associated protein 52 homolog n=1 Tax=Felis catus TaxID=9685 RepID=A0ABI8ABS5_FELCA|nr:vacuolar protein sorting-associated protein 52 homolog isoform X2 [Lynx canadensis]XP_044913320.1 vacuolar protein sorting-associated protein 52 homolog isoform X2 [Felis catus]XP_046957872.1 vacuolar protein sorting-associated protein 52 homolog isoform X2 [Lynx rufus]
MAAAATMAAAARELMLRAGASDMEEEEGPLGGGPGLQEPLQLGELDISSDEFILDEVDVHIQANLEDELVKEALKTGVDLRHYSKQVELELQQIEQKSIRDYIQESENIASLHNQITACDAVLERMEQMLGAFQSDLSSISSEIRTLQEQSGAMNIRLRNRQAVRGKLGELVDGLIVPSALITAILEAPVTEPRFLEQLQELDAKAAAVREQEARGTAACADVRGILDRLRVKAVTKIREFILQKIYSFRKPMTNYQIPQTALLKYRFFYQFLLGNERATAKEIRDEYVETLSKIYLSYYRSYLGRLMKVQYEEVAEKDDLMGVEDTAKKGFFSKPSLRSRNTIFTLGTRGSVISPTELEAPILVPHTAQRGEQRKHLESYLTDCYDAIAVFLCIHIVLRFRNIAAKRDVPALDRYWEQVLALLWPRFELILEMNVQSVRSTDPQRLGGLDTRPHYITRRYAEFSSALVSINQTIPNERTMQLLGQLQVEVENFVLRVAAEFSSRKEQLVFLINNYDMMLGVLMERAADDSKEVESFQQLLNARTQEFIEELLSPPFGGLVAFVKEAEALIERGQAERLRGEEARVTQLIRGFGSSWKSSVESLSQDVMRSFTNFRNGTSIIQGALTQLIQLYHRFHRVLSQPQLRALPARAELINIHHLMVELKKHKPNF